MRLFRNKERETGLEAIRKGRHDGCDCVKTRHEHHCECENLTERPLSLTLAKTRVSVDHQFGICNEDGNKDG
jgi:hypothetical protein